MGRLGRAGRAGRVVAAAVVAVASFGCFAFNSAEWHGKREVLTREAERLRAAYTNCVAQLQTPAEDVSVPIESFDDGSVKVLVSAKKAQYFLEKGLVWAEGVVVRKFNADGTTDSSIEARNCVIDRASKSGWAEGPATVVHGKTTFRGKGVYFSTSESYVKVFSDSFIESRDLKFGGEVKP